MDRRDFRKNAAATSAAALVPGTAALDAAQGAPPQPAAAPQGPLAATAPIAPREVDPSPATEILTTDRPGGDFMVDVLKTLNLEYVASSELPARMNTGTRSQYAL